MAETKKAEAQSKNDPELQLTSGYHALHLEAYDAPTPKGAGVAAGKTPDHDLVSKSKSKPEHTQKLGVLDILPNDISEDGGHVKFDTAGNIIEWKSANGKETRTYTYHDPNAERKQILGIEDRSIYQDKNGTFFQYEKIRNKPVPIAKLLTRSDGKYFYTDVRGFEGHHFFKRALDNSGKPIVVPITLKNDIHLRQTLDSVIDSNGHMWRREEEGKPLVEYQTSKDNAPKPTGSVATDQQLLPRVSLDKDPKEQLLYGTPDHPETSINITSVEQHLFTDCYFEAALGSEAKENPQRIKDMIVDNNDGTYTIKFPLADTNFKNSENRKSDQSTPAPTVDVTVDAPTTAELLVFNTPFMRRQDLGYWASVVEKAHRYLTGYITEDHGSEPMDAMQLITGSRQILRFGKHANDQGPSGKYVRAHLTEDPHTTVLNGSEMGWVEEVEKALDAHETVVTDTPLANEQSFILENDTLHQAFKLPDNHAMTVVAVEHSKDNGRIEILVRNQFAEVGQYRDKTEIEADKKSGGYFTLSPKDFEKAFVEITINEK